MPYILYAGDVEAAVELAEGADVEVQSSEAFGGLPEGDGALVVACSPRQNEILAVYASFGLPAYRVRDSLPDAVSKPKRKRKAKK